MPTTTISTRHILFWFLTISLCSSISTVIFSESLIHDSLGSSLIVLSMLGLMIYGAQRLFESIQDICNP